MRTVIVFSAPAIVSLGVFALWWIVRRARRPPDLQREATRYRYLHTGQDQSLGKNTAIRAAENAAGRMAVAAERSRPPAADVCVAATSAAWTSIVPTQLRPSNVVDIQRTRVAS